MPRIRTPRTRIRFQRSHAAPGHRKQREHDLQEHRLSILPKSLRAEPGTREPEGPPRMKNLDRVSGDRFPGEEPRGAHSGRPQPRPAGKSPAAHPWASRAIAPVVHANARKDGEAA